MHMLTDTYKSTHTHTIMLANDRASSALNSVQAALKDICTELRPSMLSRVWDFHGHAQPEPSEMPHEQRGVKKGGDGASTVQDCSAHGRLQICSDHRPAALTFGAAAF